LYLTRCASFRASIIEQNSTQTGQFTLAQLAAFRVYAFTELFLPSA
jgi:hypothetical protein